MRGLVVEDYTPLRSAVVSALKTEGWAVDSSNNGREGLWYAQSAAYDTIILDLMLPDKTGMDVLRELRAGGGESPVLILTARSEVDDRVAGLDAGADDYLIKPFAMTELLARVRSLVRRRGSTRSPHMVIGDLVIDTVRRMVTRDGSNIDLSPREYALLEYLANRPGEIVSRSDIWEHVYDFHADCQSNVVDVYVGYLRKKLEADDRPRLIHTKRGHGYMLAITS